MNKLIDAVLGGTAVFCGLAIVVLAWVCGLAISIGVPTLVVLTILDWLNVVNVW